MTTRRSPRAQIRRGRRAPYTMVPEWVVYAEIAPQAKAVYWVLATHVDSDEFGQGGQSEVWPAQAAIAEALGWSRPQSVTQWLDQLAAIGAITILPPLDGEADRNNHYLVHETPPSGYAGASNQAEFYQRRRARRGDRKGDAAERITPADGEVLHRDDAAERITRSGDAAERTGVVRQSAQGVMRSAASKPDSVTRLSNQNPPTPAAAGERCIHDRTSCRACGTSPRKRAAVVEASEHRLAVDCSWCRQDFASASAPFLVLDPDRPHEFLTPALRCDHVTPPEVAVAERVLGSARADLVHPGAKAVPPAPAASRRNVGDVRDHGDVQAS